LLSNPDFFVKVLKTFYNEGMKTQETPKIHLEKVTWDNYWRVIHLQVSKEQRNFIATNTLSLAHAYLNTTENVPTWPFAIYFGKKIVGFTLLCYFGDRDSYLEDNPIPFIKSSYHISRLMIDRRHQRRGYGKEALQQILEFFRSQPAGPGAYVTLYYEMENEAAKNLYASFGFVEYPESFKEGDEMPAYLKL
jgi:diamine N-acetyltransferase